MTICKKCLHGVVCGASDDSTLICNHFKDSSRYIEVPCKVGDTVYELVNWCDYTDCHFEGCAGCSHCNEKGIVERKFNYSYLGQIGKTVFLSREDAEKALKERQSHD